MSAGPVLLTSGDPAGIASGYGFAEPPVYSKTLFLDGRYDYYYVQPEDLPALDSRYVEEKRFSWVGVLLRKK